LLSGAAALLALASPAVEAASAPAKIGHATAPKARDWTQVVRSTPQGGFVMGNPNAKVKLVEFGSMTCPHCRAFDEEGVPHLLGYVKSGQLSWEFRNYVRDAYDVSAALITRCNGAGTFFPLTRAFYKEQASWEARIERTPDDQIKSIESLPPNRLFAAAAKLAGLQQLAAAHGLPAAKSNQCLSNEHSVDQLVNMAKDASTQYPDFPGTPTFVINGTMVERAFTWDALAPELKKALGERG
jgi:protein-disulfide isomerase